jgi:hypothetical protein
MSRLNRPAARFTLRSRFAGSKGVVYDVSPALSSCVVILLALSAFAKGAQRRISLFFRSPALTLKKTKTVCACAA